MLHVFFINWISMKNRTSTCTQQAACQHRRQPRWPSVERDCKVKALFIWLIIRLIQLVFSAGKVFFSHKKSVNSVFQLAYNSSRTAPNPSVGDTYGHLRGKRKIGWSTETAMTCHDQRFLWFMSSVTHVNAQPAIQDELVWVFMNSIYYDLLIYTIGPCVRHTVSPQVVRAGHCCHSVLSCSLL
jgi:hypothetical protein